MQLLTLAISIFCYIFVICFLFTAFKPKEDQKYRTLTQSLLCFVDIKLSVGCQHVIKSVHTLTINSHIQLQIGQHNLLVQPREIIEERVSNYIYLIKNEPFKYGLLTTASLKKVLNQSINKWYAHRLCIVFWTEGDDFRLSTLL